MAASALAEVLSVCGGIDNLKRKAGEERLKQISKTPEYLHNLLECAQACSDLQARMLLLESSASRSFPSPTI